MMIATRWPTLAALLLTTAAAPAQTTPPGARTALDKLPSLEGMLAGEVKPTEESGVFAVTAPLADVSILAYQVEPAGWQAAITVEKPARFSFEMLSRELAQRVLGGVKPASFTIVVSEKKGDVAVARLPLPLRRELNGFADAKSNLALAEGVNIYSALRLSDDGLLGQVKRTLEIDAPVRLSGQVDEETITAALRSFAAAEAKDAAKPKPAAAAAKKPKDPFGVRLTVELPPARPFPYGLAGDKDLIDVLFESTTLTISGQGVAKAGDSSLGVSGSQRVSLWVLGRKTEIENTLALKPSGQAWEIALSGTRTLDWKSVFGIDGLEMRQVSLSGTLTPPGKGDGGSGGIAIGATVALPRHGALEGKFAVTTSGKAITDLKLSLEGQEGGGVDFGALPAYRRLPGISEIALTKLALGINPKEREVYVQGSARWGKRDLEGEMALLTRDQALILFLQVEGLNLRKLVPSLPEQAELIGSDRSMLVLSTHDFADLQARTVPESVKGMITRVNGNLERKLPVFQGVTLFMRFDPATLSPDLRQAVESIGVTEPAVLAGSAGQITEAAPKLALYADLPALPIPQRHAAFIKPRATGAGARLFLATQVEGGGPQVRLGLEGTVGVRLGREDVEFAGQAYVLVSAMSQGVRLAGMMNGTWNEPFELAGVSLGNLVIGGGVDADSSLELALGGEAEVGELRYKVGGLVSVITASGGIVPKKVGLSFEGSEISQLTGLQLMGGFMKAAVGGPMANAVPDGATRSLLQQASRADLVGTVGEVVPLPYVTFKDVAVYLVTPGATFPGLDMEGMGIGIKGSMNFMSRDLGRVEYACTVKDGLTIYAAPGEVDIGALALSGARVDVRVPMPGLPVPGAETAHFIIGGDLSAGCSALEGGMEIKLARKSASFTHHAKLAGYETDFEAEVDLSKWPSFAGRGRGRGDMIKDVLDSVMSQLEARANEAREKARAAADDARREVKKRKAAAEDALDQGRAQARTEAQAALDSVGQEARQQADRFKGKPAIRTALNKVADASKELKLAKDDAVAGVQKVRNAIDAVADGAKGDVKDAAQDIRKRLEEAMALAKSIPERARELPRVKKATEAVAEAQRAVDDLRGTLMKEKVDPAAAAATDLLSTLRIEKVGFESGVEVLCKGRLPRLNVTGTFAGKPFDAREGLQLARQQDFAKVNRESLARLADRLIALIDSEKVDAFTASLGAER
jgi:hypothetical protein